VSRLRSPTPAATARARRAVHDTRLYAAAVRHVLQRASGSPRDRLGRPDERLVFVVGCPRSGTTFLAGAIGALPGFVDLGEVHPLKAAIPTLACLPPEAAGQEVRRVLQRVRVLGLVPRLRGVEQTPETAFVLAAALDAYPQARAVHLLRDGRDVVCSLLERGWLRAGRTDTDDARRPLGSYARFWVEPERRDEFVRVSEARRAAWAWRRYVSAARAVDERVLLVRFEELTADPSAAAVRLARQLEVPLPPLERALGAAHRRSVGRYRDELSPEQRRDVEQEAGELLHELGYGDG
jgi:hypothetical protein